MVLFFIYGLVIGSFLNVCIYRIPKKVSVSKGRSHCPSCDQTLTALDLVPVFSYLFLRGKCRHCKVKISPRYALVELLTAFAFALVYVNFGLTLYAILACILTCVLIVVAFIDLDTKEINDRMHVIIIGLAVVNLVSLVSQTGDISVIRPYVIGFLIVSVPMLLIAMLTGGFGGGDIKLMAASGLFLGAAVNVVAFFIGAFIAALIAVIMLITKRADRKSQIAFGPYLAMGIYLSMLYGQEMIDAYVSLF